MPARAARPRPTPKRPTARPAADPTAEPLHRNAIHLLRLLRREDADARVPLSAARLSALSVLVFGGACTLGELAAAEQVSAPTMSRLVQELEHERWITRRSDPEDARSSTLAATPAAVRLLHDARERRLLALSRALGALTDADRFALEWALPAFERLVLALRGGSESAASAPRTGRRRLD